MLGSIFFLFFKIEVELATKIIAVFAEFSFRHLNILNFGKMNEEGKYVKVM